MNLSLPEEAVRAIVQKSLLESMTQEHRDELVSQAIAYLMKPEKPSYGYGQPISPLEQGVREAAQAVVRQMTLKWANDNEGFKAQIESLFADVAKRLFAPDGDVREKVIETIANTIARGLDR